METFFMLKNVLYLLLLIFSIIPASYAMQGGFSYLGRRFEEIKDIERKKARNQRLQELESARTKLHIALKKYVTRYYPVEDHVKEYYALTHLLMQNPQEFKEYFQTLFEQKQKHKADLEVAHIISAKLDRTLSPPAIHKRVDELRNSGELKEGI